MFQPLCIFFANLRDSLLVFRKCSRFEMFSCNYRNAIVNIIFRMQQGTEGTSLYIRNIPKLTLFPRVSKTSETNRRNFRLFSHHSPPNRVFSSAIPAISNSLPVS